MADGIEAGSEDSVMHCDARFEMKTIALRVRFKMQFYAILLGGKNTLGSGSLLLPALKNPL